jgi:internalin A
MADTDGMAIACERIVKELTDRTGFLDLGHLGLTALPKELGTLTHLKVLNLGSSWIDQEGRWRFYRDREDANRLGAADWTFFERLLQLESLAVAGCSIGNIRPLVAARNLTRLILNDNPVSDLSALSNLRTLQSLDCSGTQVSDLSALSNLQTLQTLSCSGTQVSDLSALSNLQTLQSLNCSETQVSDLSALSNLQTLQSLDCWGTQVSDLSALSNLQALQSLDCWGTQVSDLSALSNLQTLQSLDCAGTQVSDLSPLSNLQALQSLDCSGTQVSDLSALSNLQTLESLSCSGSQVSDLSALSNLEGLQSLNCWETQVSDLSALSNLQALQSLLCWRTQVSDLSALSNLQALQSLHCWDTQVSDLSVLSSLAALQSFACSGTQVSDLSVLSNLEALQSLDCSRTQVSDLSALSNLQALRVLNCSETQVNDLSALSNLQALRLLNCSETRVSDLSALSNLQVLESIDCSGTQVSDLGVIAKIPALRRLSASGIPISRIPESLVFKPELKTLQLLNVPETGIPPEVLSKSTHTSCLEELRSHFRDLQKGAVPLSDIKIMVLGNGRIGKTQICRRLRNEPYEEDADSTHGITVTSTRLLLGKNKADDDDDILLHLWDFGGQDIYHGTHALFMQSRAIFFAVWTPESEDRKEHEHRGIRFRNHRLDYWLELVRQFGSANSPVLLIQTRCDKVEDELRGAPAPDELLDKFRFCKLLHYSARENRGRATLDEALIDAVGWVREHQGHATIGIGRLKVRRRLEKLRQDDAALPASDRKHRVISRTFFDQLCEEEGGTSNPEHLLAYLHECGVIFYRPGIFADAIILDQEWALEAIYTVFNREKCWRQLRQLNGRFTQSLLATLVWQEYDEGEQALFIDLMVSAGICFVHRETDPRVHTETEYIAPDLLPEVTEVEEEIGAFWQDEPGEEQVLDFPFEHPGLIRGVVARIGRGAGMNAVYWKGGVCGFERRTHSAIRIDTLPSESENSHSLRIKVRTQRGRAKDLLAQAVEWIEEEARKSGSPAVDYAAKPEAKAVVRKHSRSHRDDKTGELGKMPIPEKPDFGPPPRKAQRTYCVSYAWTKESSDFVDQLCDRARIGGIDVIRDKTHLGLGERISKFMRRLGAGDRVFVILSEKYLRSPFCMSELLEVWRESRQEEDEFLQRIRVYRLPDARIGTPVERMKIAIFWREQFEELNALVKQHGADLLGADDFRRYKLMGDFAFRVGDILSLVMDTLQPKTLDEFEKFNFESESIVR